MMKMAGLVAGLTALIMGFTPFAPVPPAAPTAPIPDYTAIRVPRTTVQPMVTITQTPTPINVGQDQHSAFPGMALRPDGTLWLTWRRGSNHASARDGQIWGAISYDGGVNFQHAKLLRADGDDRDPSVSVIDGVEFMTWFTGSATNAAQGATGMREWGQARRIDPGLPWAAISAPMVKLPNGLIGAVFYAKKPGESIPTAFAAWSWDGGWSWDSNRIANSIGAGVAHTEPYAVVDDTWVHVFYRDGDSAIAMRSSSQSMVSGWNEPRRILTDATGRPTVARTSSGALVMVYRQASTGAARIAYSTDRGATWWDGGVLLASKGGLGMTYATMTASGGDVVGVMGMEEGAGGVASKLYRFRLAL